MGIDISMYPERRVDGMWCFAGQMIPNPYYHPDDPEFDPNDPEFGRPLIAENIFTNRISELFAILGSPRNPCRSVEKYEVIAPLRGLPQDCSPEVKIECGPSECFANAGASWLLLRELLEFDWLGKTIRKTGIVPPEAAHLFPPGQSGWPWHQWPKGVMQSVSEQGRGTRVYWTETYAQSAHSFFTETLPMLQTFGPPDEVRVVYWFDS